MQIIQKKENMKIWFVMSIFEKHKHIKYMRFASTSENGALTLYLKKKQKFLKKTAKHCKYFCLFYKKFISKQRSSL